jgi:abortive infection bacteriophage resistance protein
MPMSKVPYNKPPLTFQDQVKALKERGLIINDEERANRYLQNINYYRLSAYFIPFEQSGYDIENRNHNFISNTSFDDIINLYIFDRELKILVMEAIESIEISVRTLWAYHLSSHTKNAHAYMDAVNFSDPYKHLQHLNKLAFDLEQSSETHVKHYFTKYSEPFLPPIWAVVEIMSFGTLSKWYQNTKNTKAKQAIALALGLPTIEILESVLQVSNLVRNICAHHGRLWNRKLIKRLTKIKRLSAHMVTEDILDQSGKIQTQLTNTLFNLLVILVHMIRTINPNTSWTQRLKTHILSLSSEHRLAMGCPENFESQAFWQGQAEGAA